MIVKWACLSVLFTNTYIECVIVYVRLCIWCWGEHWTSLSCVCVVMWLTWLISDPRHVRLAHKGMIAIKMVSVLVRSCVVWTETMFEHSCLTKIDCGCLSYRRCKFESVSVYKPLCVRLTSLAVVVTVVKRTKMGSRDMVSDRKRYFSPLGWSGFPNGWASSTNYYLFWISWKYHIIRRILRIDSDMSGHNISWLSILVRFLWWWLG